MILKALLVTFLWATSWVLIAVGLRDPNLPALPFAGLRYGLAAALLLALAASRSRVRRELRAASAADWRWIAALGVVLYAITQGAQFVALSVMPAASMSTALALTPVVVAVIGRVALGERLRPRVWSGVVVAAAGALWFGLSGGSAFYTAAGVVAAVVGLGANSAAAVMGRHVNRMPLSALAITAPSMAIGAVLLLAVGIPVQGVPHLDGKGWLIVAWLAVVNTAFAFTLWNHTLTALSAGVSATLNNTLAIQIPLLAWLALGQALSVWQWAAIVVVGAGTLAASLPAPRRLLPVGARPARTGPSAST